MTQKGKNLYKIIGKRFKELRQSLDTFETTCTQKMLAEKLNVTVSLISKLERGDKMPSLECVCMYSKFFRVSTDYILGKSENMRTNCSAYNIFNEETLNSFNYIKFNYDTSGDRSDTDLLNILYGTPEGQNFLEKLKFYLFSEPKIFHCAINKKIKNTYEINVISDNGYGFNLFPTDVPSILKNDLLNIIDKMKTTLKTRQYDVTSGEDGMDHFYIRSYEN